MSGDGRLGLWPEDFWNRLGAFHITHMDLMQHGAAYALAVLDGCIVVRCEMLYTGPGWSYIAAHHEFERVEPGLFRAPEYRPVVDGGKRVRWERVPP
jgi:hypothetical protein